MKKTLFAMIIAACLAITACGGGGGACNFDILTFTNGATVATATSAWACQCGNQVFAFVFADDGAGFDTTIGAFTWTETGCRQVAIDSAFGDATITDIDGSIASGIATFHQSGDLGEGDCSCVLASP